MTQVRWENKGKSGVSAIKVRLKRRGDQRCENLRTLKEGRSNGLLLVFINNFMSLYFARSNIVKKADWAV